MTKHLWLALVAIAVAGCGAISPSSPAQTGATASPVPTATSTAAPTSAPPTAQPTPLISPEPPGWHRVGPTTGLEDVVGLGVVGWFKDRWVAFGDTTDGPATWWSLDGIAWHPGDVRPAGAMKSPDVHVVAIATNEDVAVAVGSWRERSSGGSLDLPLADSGSSAGAVSWAVGQATEPRVVTAATCERMAGADAAVLTSTDGITWTRVPDSRALRGQPMLGVAAFHGGFVAAGGADGTGRSATWTSPDGRHWTRASDDAALRAGWIGDVATFGDSLIAVGGSACGNMGGVPRAWRSADGRSWSLETGLFRGSCCGAAQRVAVSGTLAVVAGSVSTQDGGEPAGATWTGTDGSHWIVHPQTAQPDLSWLGRIVATTDGFLLAEEGVWTTTDGVTWTNVVSPSLNFGSIAVGPGGTLAVGDEIWMGPASVAPH